MNIKLNYIKLPIEDITEGMFVQSYDEKNDVVVAKEVTETSKPIVEFDKQIRIYYDGGYITTSINHPIMTRDNDTWCYKKAGELIIGSPLLMLDSIAYKSATVIKIDRGNLANEQFFDIGVNGTHCYFAAANKDQEMILSHNSATVFYPIWHYQFEDLIVLKNNQGTDENRVRHMDYGVVMSSFFLKRFKNQEQITFFDPNEVPELYEAYYKDIASFEKLYVQYEQRKDLKKKTMSAVDVFKGGILKERTDTGRIYCVFIDNVQRQGSFDPKVNTVYQSNLCCLTGDNMVEVFDGHQHHLVSIEELSRQYTEYSIKPSLFIKSFSEFGICWQPIETVWLTKTVTELIDVEYNGEIVTCTPDHKFLTTRGWIMAQDLLETDILMLGNHTSYKYEYELRKTLQSTN